MGSFCKSNDVWYDVSCALHDDPRPNCETFPFDFSKIVQCGTGYSRASKLDRRTEYGDWRERACAPDLNINCRDCGGRGRSWKFVRYCPAGGAAI